MTLSFLLASVDGLNFKSEKAFVWVISALFLKMNFVVKGRFAYVVHPNLND